MLPNWLKQLADECPPEDAAALEKKLTTPKTQNERDRAYRARLKAEGIVERRVRVPAHRWTELQEIAAKMRGEAC